MTSAIDNEHSLKRKRNYGSIAAEKVTLLLVNTEKYGRAIE